MKLVLVEWVDHCSGNGDWEEIADVAAMTPCAVKTVGWIVQETDKYLTLASTIEDTHCHGIMLILENCIVSRKVLKE